jgi:Na+/proline symporter
VVGIAVLVITYFRPPILYTYAFAVSGSGFAQLIPLMFGGLLWKKANKYGAFSGLISGTVILCVLQFGHNPFPDIQPVLWSLLINTILFIVVSLATTQNDGKGVDEIVVALKQFFASRDNQKLRVFHVLIALLFFQMIIVPFLLPAGALAFGWLPLPTINFYLLMVESSVVAYLYAKNRLYEPDGSIKEFTGLMK